MTPTPYYDDGQVRLLQGDVREVLRGMEAESVQCVVTSPPYWSLRDYGVPPSVWGGDETHLHDWEDEAGAEGYQGTARWQHSSNGRGEEAPDEKKLRVSRELRPEAWGEVGRGATCQGCGAWRGALGLEPTPEMFVAHTVDVFREVHRVLRKDGTLWLNIGDSYAGSWGAQGRTGSMAERPVISSRQIGEHPQFQTRTGARGLGDGIKPKDLVGIPWMLAFALRADGWWLRQDIIWHKPNPMPESTRDRCTKSHEYLFLLAKSERYYYDQDAIREDSSPNTNARTSKAQIEEITAARAAGANTTAAGMAVTTKSAPAGSGIKANDSYHHAMALPVETRNKRDVWSIPTAPYPEAHFATFPPALVEPCILAGCPEGGVVLDPFVGSGTTAMVARQLGRRAVGIDLNPEYMAMAVGRIGAQMALLPAGEAS